VAIDNLPNGKNWNMCCEVAIGKRIGHCSTQNASAEKLVPKVQGET